MGEFDCNVGIAQCGQAIAEFAQGAINGRHLLEPAIHQRQQCPQPTDGLACQVDAAVQIRLSGQAALNGAALASRQRTRLGAHLRGIARIHGCRSCPVFRQQN
jgi:hypothetical protein